MSGTSRALSKALDTIFSQDNETPLDTSELFSVISQYLQTHNTLTSIQQQSFNINDELFRIYDKYIMPLENLSRECMFVDVLTKLSPVLTIKEVSLWVKSYLKPVVDSAGYDSIFVEKSREFIKRVTSHPEETDDLDLFKVRQDIGQVIIEQILSINLSNNTLEQMLDLKVSELQKDSQTYQERLRFIKSNCSRLLQEYGINQTKSYCELLNYHITIPSQRLQTLTLLSSLVSSSTPGVSKIINMSIFSSVLKCSMFDFSEIIIHTSLTILTMLIPQVTQSISKYLPDLLMIYIRITTWEEFNSISNRLHLLTEYMQELNINWNIAVDNEEQETAELTFNYPHFYVLLYGLFPINLSKFTQGPYAYLKLHQPKFINLKYLQKLEELLEISLDLHIGKKTRSIIQGFLIHPKFLEENCTIEQELENPVSWIGQGKTSEDIGLACFSLNPDIMINLNDESSLYERMLPRSLTSQVDIDSMNNRISRGSSMDGIKDHKYLYLKSFHNLNRKLSIIPTNLVINKEQEEQQEDADPVHFKDIKYENVEDSIDSLDGSSRSPGDPLQDLFTTHEKLYTPKDNDILRRKSSSLILKHELRLSRPTSSPTTTLETSSVFKEGGSVNDTLTSINNVRSEGNMVDFYQRELLLFKNELEFSSFMKHLNKYNYIKLKLSLNKSERTTQENNLKQWESLKIECNELTELLNTMKVKLEQTILDHEKERDQLLNRLDEIQIDKEEFARKYEIVTSENRIESNKLKQLVNDVIPEKDYEIVDLKMKIKHLEEQANNEVTIPQQNPELEKKLASQQETINRLKSEMLVLSEKYNQIVSELAKSQESYESMIKKYEHKLTSSKLNLNENLNSFTSQYERKIQELTTTLLKYEHLLEEKNGKILQLSSSKPISIPSYGRANSGTSFEQHTDRSHSSSESSSPPLPIAIHQHLPHHPATAPIVSYGHYQSTQPQAIRNNSVVSSSSSQQVPIMRGRGGYQKRSKKLM